MHSRLELSQSIVKLIEDLWSRRNICALSDLNQWTSFFFFFLESCDVNYRFLLFSAVWPLLYEQWSVGVTVLVMRKAKQTSRLAPHCRTPQPHLWDATGGSFIRLRVKVTANVPIALLECYWHLDGGRGLWDCSTIQVTDTVVHRVSL